MILKNNFGKAAMIGDTEVMRSIHDKLKEAESLELVDKLNRLIRLSDLQDLTVCRMAQRDLAKGDVEGALKRLRVDADKIRSTCRELYDLINANFFRGEANGN